MELKYNNCICVIYCKKKINNLLKVFIYIIENLFVLLDNF